MPTCPNCGQISPSDASACPCGYQLAGNQPISPPPLTQTSQPTESDKAVGVAAGAVMGMGCSAMFFVCGLLLSLTGIGAIIGVPMMLGALVLPFLMPALGLAAIKSPCPYCRTTVRARSTDPGVTCPGCKKRVVIRDKQFIRVD
jgi:DNA-directed RNA polymerase subunit RPC12/RpoP